MDQATQISLEAYLQQRRCFSIIGAGNLINKDCFQTIENMHSSFVYQFAKAKNDLNQSSKYKPCLMTYTRTYPFLLYRRTNSCRLSSMEWTSFLC
jgi:hypothetical protein